MYLLRVVAVEQWPDRRDRRWATGAGCAVYFAIPEPFELKAFGADGWYRSGDLGSLDEEGGLHFHSRATEMIKTGGINVAPREVEEFLALHPAVENVAVVGVPDERLAEVVVAFIVGRAGEDPSEAELRAWCAERIASFKVASCLATSIFTTDACACLAALVSASETT